MACCPLVSGPRLTHLPWNKVSRLCLIQSKLLADKGSQSLLISWIGSFLEFWNKKKLENLSVHASILDYANKRPYLDFSTSLMKHIEVQLNVFPKFAGHAVRLEIFLIGLKSYRILPSKSKVKVVSTCKIWILLRSRGRIVNKLYNQFLVHSV